MQLAHCFLDEFIGGTVRAPFYVFGNQGFDFGFEMNRHALMTAHWLRRNEELALPQ